MLVRFVIYASLAWMALGIAGAPTIPAKTGCGIDPNGEPCPPCSGASAGVSLDGGSGIDPNGQTS
jgi:hypothetical protein